MANVEKFPMIDYEDLIEDLIDDIESDFIQKDSKLYIIRQNSEIQVECADNRIFKPVVEYFYSVPAVQTTLFDTTVDAAKKVCYSLPEILDRAEDDEPTISKDSAKANINMLIEDLSDYTKGNGKRNDRSCKILLTEVVGTMPAFPMAVYFEENDICSDVDTMSAEELLAELRLCAGKNN